MRVLEELTGAVQLSRIEQAGCVTFRCRLANGKESDLVYLCDEDEPLPNTLDDLLLILHNKVMPTKTPLWSDRGIVYRAGK